MKVTQTLIPLTLLAMIVAGCGDSKEEAKNESEQLKKEGKKGAGSFAEPIELTGYPGDLASVLDQAIASLQDGDIKTFAEKMFPAEDVRWLREQDGLANLEFRVQAYPELVTQTVTELSALKQTAAEADPSVDAVSLGENYRFEKVQGTWRFADHSSAVNQAIQENGKLPGQGGGGFLGIF